MISVLLAIVNNIVTLFNNIIIHVTFIQLFNLIFQRVHICLDAFTYALVQKAFFIKI